MRALAEVVVAVTSHQAARFVGLISGASLFVVGGVTPCGAQVGLERGMFSFKSTDYQDWQPGAKRVDVRSQSVLLRVPFQVNNPGLHEKTGDWGSASGDWIFDAQLTSDAISGASPMYHAQMIRAVVDQRYAQDVRITRVFDTSTITIGRGVSRESDYFSQAISLSGSFVFDAKHSTVNWAVSHSDDNIQTLRTGPRRKNVNDWLVGYTRVWNQQTLAQFSVSGSHGNGYFSDPYKLLDQRPDFKDSYTAMLRWYQHLVPLDAISRISYRRYVDSYGVQSHMLNWEWAHFLSVSSQPVNHEWVLTPSIRLYNQKNANFYIGPTVTKAIPRPPGIDSSTIVSLDQRLSAFGAMTLGLKLSKRWGPRYDPRQQIDLRVERYSQDADWFRIANSATVNQPELPRFHARWIQLGYTSWF